MIVALCLGCRATVLGWDAWDAHAATCPHLVPTGGWKHGLTGYAYHRCRCLVCREAKRRYEVERRASA